MTYHTTEQRDPRVWLITGACRGLGLALALECLNAGDSVVAGCRAPGALIGLHDSYRDRLLLVELNVCDASQCKAATDVALGVFGHIDVLVNNAGYALLGAIEDASPDEAYDIFSVNVFGPINMLRCVLPHMRSRRRGVVINVSSTGGFIGRSGWGLYSATKFAIEGLSEALRDELRPLGITVTIVQPGPFRTDFLGGASLKVTASQSTDYNHTPVALRREYVQLAHGNQPGSPEKAAHIIRTLASLPDTPLRIALGSYAVRAVKAKLDSLHAEFREWAEYGLDADFFPP